MMTKSKILIIALAVTLPAIDVETAWAQSGSTWVQTKAHQGRTMTKAATPGNMAGLQSVQDWSGGNSADKGPALRFGVQGGFFLDQKNPYLGIHFKHSLVSNFVLIAPSVEYALRGNGTFFTVSADAQYLLPSRSNVNFWFGAGLSMARLTFEEKGNDTSFGINLLSGVNFKGSKVVPFVGIKMMLYKNSEIAIGGGVTF